MTRYSRVLWQEGMFLRAQHFQQQERWIEQVTRQMNVFRDAHGWGLTSLVIDEGPLANGRLCISKAAGIFPDGTPFAFPEIDAANPQPIEIDASARGKLIYLAMPDPPAHDIQVVDKRGATGRLSPAYVKVNDAHFDDDTDGLPPGPEELVVGRLHLRLLREDQARGGFSCIPIGRVQDISPTRKISLDDEFIPPVLACHAAPRLADLLSGLVGKINQLSAQLSGSLGGVSARGITDQLDFRVLQILNRSLPLLRHWNAAAGVHPERLYETLIQLVGEWATFTDEARRAPDYSAHPYRHDDLQSTFKPVIADLERLFPGGFDPRKIEIPLTEIRHGLRRGAISDHTLLNSAAFYLVVEANLPSEALRRLFPLKTKIGPYERMNDLITSAVSGISVRSIAPPWQLGLLADAHCFELDRGGLLWPEMSDSAAFGIHVSEEPPGMKLRLWAVLS